MAFVGLHCVIYKLVWDQRELTLGMQNPKLKKKKKKIKTPPHHDMHNIIANAFLLL